MEVLSAVGLITAVLGVCLALTVYFHERHIKATVSGMKKIVKGEK